jgi:hypothetical protein
MSATGPIQRVVNVLEDAGYEIIEQPRRISGIPFEFAAMLAGRGSLDLVLLVDLAVEADDERIRRRVVGLAGALDLVRSRRSLTVILVGPSRGPDLIQAIGSVARVLTAGSPGEADQAGLRDAIAVLLPLEVATEKHNEADPWPAARDRIASAHPAETNAILSATRLGSVAVENALRDILSEPIDSLFGVEDDEVDE